MENRIHGKTSGKKRVIRIAASAVVIAALAVAVYIRTNPEWMPLSIKN